MNFRPTYMGFSEFFSQNRLGAEKEYEDLHSEFKNTFDKVLHLGVGKNLGSGQKQKGVSMALYLRAAKYLYSSHELSISGHTEEARILLRNSIELLILGFLIHKENEVYLLWNECHDLRINLTGRHGEVSMESAANKKYWISSIRDKYKSTLEKYDESAHLYSAWKTFSTRYSHENMYNIAVRLESCEEKTEIYIGDGYNSKTGRLAKNLHLTLDILQDILIFVRDLHK